jgi:hypothetical protein
LSSTTEEVKGEGVWSWLWVASKNPSPEKTCFTKKCHYCSRVLLVTLCPNCFKMYMNAFCIMRKSLKWKFLHLYEVKISRVTMP